MSKVKVGLAKGLQMNVKSPLLELEEVVEEPPLLDELLEVDVLPLLDDPPELDVLPDDEEVLEEVVLEVLHGGLA